MIKGKKLLHCIYLNDILKRMNIGETQTLSSLMYNSIFFPNIRSDYYTIPIDIYETRAYDIFSGLVNPRCGILVESSIIISGTKIRKKGEIMTTEEERIVKSARIELKFEEIRRKINPAAPSRLTCLFLVADDEDMNGRILLGEYLPSDSVDQLF